MFFKEVKINKTTYRIFDPNLDVRLYFAVADQIEQNSGLCKARYDNLIKRNASGPYSYFEEQVRYNNLIKSNDLEPDDYFEGKLTYSEVYLKPLKYNEEVAYECGLIPFKYSGEYEELKLLALCSYDKGLYARDVRPKLDAYQALLSGTIDKHSWLFKDRAYFEFVIGKGLTEKVLKAIIIEKKSK